MAGSQRVASKVYKSVHLASHASLATKPSLTAINGVDLLYFIFLRQNRSEVYCIFTGLYISFIALSTIGLASDNLRAADARM